MGSLFRSEEMTLCQLFLQSETAYTCVSQLGELGLVQFRDLNPDVNAFQRKFVNEVRRCDEMERKIRYLEKEIKRDHIPMLDVGDRPPAPLPREMIDLEATFEKLESDLNEVNTNVEALKKTFLELTELKHILHQTQTFFRQQEMLPQETEAMHKSLVANESQAVTEQLSFVSGVILRERVPAFERMLWRVCRGMAFLRQCDIATALEDPVTGDEVWKSVFIIFFQGEQLKTKVMKICEGFRATLYPCPDTYTERVDMSNGIMSRIADLSIVLKQSQDHRHRVLVTSAKNIKTWFVSVRKIKAIYITLNLFNLDVTQKCLIAECWCPVKDLEKIQLALRKGTEDSGGSVPSILNRMESDETPPTYNRTNRFTEGFQNIVNAYGVSDYREVNPAPFTIITFPFLFAVMFGDFGHGVLMFLFALWMVIKEKSLIAQKSTNEIWNNCFSGRYIILLMGAFSIYTGLIYNDVFSKSFNIFHSSWSVSDELFSSTDAVPDMRQMDPNSTSTFSGKPYPFGIDPVWQLAANKIGFLNSYKMKTSIIFGVAQMLFGVLLGMFNHTYFRHPLNIYCEFIPQIIFLMCLFGYLVFLIFYKWVHSSVITVGCSPSLLIHFINMFLFTYPSEPCNLAEIFPGQKMLQTVLVVLTVICIPWMLLIKPLIIRHQILSQLRQTENHGSTLKGAEEGHVKLDDQGESSTDVESEAQERKIQSQVKTQKSGGHSAGGHGGGHGGGGHIGPDGKFDFFDLFIHQAIPTIEYCLGSISHTASYLRLWALSLAHAQLSEVLWNMVLKHGLSVGSWYGCVFMYVIFTAWAGLTVGVLLIMEGLSAFLHALRLHWVEFQSKFYGGTGYVFTPFDFEIILEIADSEEL